MSRNFLFALFSLALLAPLPAFSAAQEIKLDRAPVELRDTVSLQRGAKTFINYCLHCHSASYMRYNRLTDLGLTEQQIKDNLLFEGDKVGQRMTVAMRKDDAREWFGAVPPDLTVIARSRGADWLYTYLREFYRDDSRPTGWNNVVFDKVNMPHALYQLQGAQRLEKVEVADATGEKHVEQKLVLAEPGQLAPLEYDRLVGDLVNYLVYMGEPSKITRLQLGIVTLFFLGLLFVLAYFLKKEYWKDVH
ncbi:MAG: cytochrome c1 [Burkholderiales bacterium]|nr:cytochrome c1 [Burkholderiales bacterium]